MIFSPFILTVLGSVCGIMIRKAPLVSENRIGVFRAATDWTDEGDSFKDFHLNLKKDRAYDKSLLTKKVKQLKGQLVARGRFCF